MGALEDLVNTPDPQPQSGGSALEALANSPDTATQRTGLDAVANDPNNIPLDSYAHATERGIANIGQGVAQAIQATGHAIAHPIDTAQSIGLIPTSANPAEQAAKVVSAVRGAPGAIKQAVPTDLLSAGDAAGRGAGQIIAGEMMGRVPGAAIKTGTAAGRGVKYVRELYKPLADVTEGTVEPSTGVVDPRVGLKSPLPGPKNPAVIQPVIQQGIRDTVSSVAKEAGVPESSAASIRDVVRDTAENVKAKSQPVFQKLDELSRGQFGDAQAEAKRYRGAIDKAGKDAYALALKKQDAIFDTFQSQFDADTFVKAKAQWRQYRALQDVDDAVNSATTGQRPEVTKGSSAARQPSETVNPKALLKNLNALYRDGTLETAVGKDAAHQLLDHAGAAQGTAEGITEHNKQFLTENRASQASQVETAKAKNAATVASNRAKNEAIIEANKAKNAAILAKRNTVKHVVGYGATAATGTALGGYAVRKALGGDQ